MWAATSPFYILAPRTGTCGLVFRYIHYPGRKSSMKSEYSRQRMDGRLSSPVLNLRTTSKNGSFSWRCTWRECLKKSLLDHPEWSQLAGVSYFPVHETRHFVIGFGCFEGIQPIIYHSKACLLMKRTVPETTTFWWDNIYLPWNPQRSETKNFLDFPACDAKAIVLAEFSLAVGDSNFQDKLQSSNRGQSLAKHARN